MCVCVSLSLSLSTYIYIYIYNMLWDPAAQVPRRGDRLAGRGAASQRLSDYHYHYYHDCYSYYLVVLLIITIIIIIDISNIIIILLILLSLLFYLLSWTRRGYRGNNGLACSRACDSPCGNLLCESAPLFEHAPHERRSRAIHGFAKRANGTRDMTQRSAIRCVLSDDRARSIKREPRSLRSVLMISTCRISNWGSQIPAPFYMFTSRCPLKVQMSQGLGTFFQIELWKTGRTRIGHIFRESTRRLTWSARGKTPEWGALGTLDASGLGVGNARYYTIRFYTVLYYTIL